MTILRRPGLFLYYTLEIEPINFSVFVKIGIQTQIQSG